MSKKITQFRYFGDDANTTRYKLVPSDIGEGPGYISINKYTNMKSDGELYKKIEINNEPVKYIRVDEIENDVYDSECQYYKVREQLYNYPPEITQTKLSSGSIFQNFTPIVKLGIQSIPGTKFRINANLEWIILGINGMYEIDLTNSSASINSLTFDDQSLLNIQNNKNGYLLIDIMYEEEG